MGKSVKYEPVNYALRNYLIGYTWNKNKSKSGRHGPALQFTVRLLSLDRI